MQVRAPMPPLQGVGSSSALHQQTEAQVAPLEVKPLCHTMPLLASDLEHLNGTAGSTHSSPVWKGEPVLAQVRASPSASHPEGQDPTGSAGEWLLCQHIKI